MSEEQFTTDQYVKAENVVPILVCEGAGITLLSERNVELTLKEAERILSLPTMPRDVERTLVSSHVDYLIRAMTRGTFRPEMVRLVTGELDGIDRRYNGQHTCWARLSMPDDYPCKIKLAHYGLESEHDASVLYASIDRGMSRTKAMVVHTYLYGVEGFEHIGKKLMGSLSNGLAFWLFPSDHIRKQYDGDDIAKLMEHEHRGLVLTVSNFIGPE